MSIVEGAAPPPEGVVPNLEHPEDVLHTINLVSQILSFTTVTLFMLLRIYAKAFVAPPFHAEDLSHYGGGYHIWELWKSTLTSSLGLYADTLVYGPNSFFTKLALLLIVIRVFRFHQKTKTGIYITIICMAAYYVPVFFLKTFICRPIPGYWDPKIHAKCFNQRQIFVADTVISAVSDLAVLCLPIPAAVRLRMSWNRRLKVMAMLSAGGIATAASLVRMVIVIRLQISQDPTVDFIRFNLLGTAEVSIGMICACFPAINILLTRRAEGSRESSHNTTSMNKASLKFLGGSRLRTQRMTEVQTMPQTMPQTVPQTVAMEEARVPPPTHQTPQRASQETGDCIFPIERLSRLPPALQRTWNKETWPDEWCTNLCTSPFSDPGAPEWARKGAGAD
ncbi:hypothetical protein LZ32DRAFT_639569 [Colletotrichum eremochloae]|nr:hypothetical protein LZ32DRAFT_639569 [Colletotrichum eremochloae]